MELEFYLSQQQTNSNFFLNKDSRKFQQNNSFQVTELCQTS